MTVHNKRISPDVDFTMSVVWTRDGVAVPISDARLVFTFNDVDTEVATLAAGTISQTGDTIFVDVPQTDLPAMAEGPGSYVLAVETSAGERLYLVEGGLSVQPQVVTW